MLREWQIDDEIHRLILFRFFENKKRLQHVVRFMSHELDSMTYRADIDVFFDVLVHVVSEVFSFQQIENSFVLEMINVQIITILLQKFFFKKLWKMCHLFFQRNKLFSMFHLNNESRSTFLRLLFDTTSSSFFELKRFAFSFSLSCFIDAFSTKNRIRCASKSDCCRINRILIYWHSYDYVDVSSGYVDTR